MLTYVTLLGFDFDAPERRLRTLTAAQSAIATGCIASAMRASQGYQNCAESRQDWIGNFQETRPYPTGTWNS